MPTFNHLHCHTQFSLLDGAADITKMLTKAKNDGMRGCAITDHGNMFGVFKFVAEATKIGIKPIVGCEFYLVEDRHKRQFTKGEKDKRYHQLFLAKNEEGYRNLVKLCSLGFIEGMYGKYPRIDKSLILKYHKGLIATTCCIGAEVPQTILKKGEAEGEKVFKWWLDLFGEDYYIELQNHEIPDQLKVNEVLKKFAKKYGVKMIASNDSHYVEREDFNAHDILLCINTGEKQSTPTLKEFSDDDDASAFKGKRFAFYNDQFYFKTTSEMVQLFQDIPEAIDNTNEIVDKCDHLKLKKDILLPNYPIPNEFPDQDAYLRHLTFEGARKRYKELTPEVEERLNFELNTIRTMGFAGYFLIVQDYINAGRELGVFVGPGRGCLTGDMKVVMANGTSKELAKVEIGDEVITHDGSVKKVTNRFEYDVNEDLLKIHAHYGDFVGINLTKDHKVLAEKVNTGINKRTKTPVNLNARPQGNLTWHKASELTKDDWLFIPVLKSANPPLQSIDLGSLLEEMEVELTDTHISFQNELGFKEKVARTITLDKDWLRLIGMMTAADWEWDESKKEVQLVVRKDADLLNLFHKRLNAQGWTYTETSYSQYNGQGHERTRTLQINIPSKVFYFFLKYLFPRYKHSIESKHVPDFITYSEREQMLTYLNGFMSVAGSKKRTAQAIGTHSRELADQLRFLYWQLKAPVNMVVQEIKRAFTKRLRYTLTIPNESRINPLRIDAFTHSRPLKNANFDGIMVQVKSVSNLKGVKKVYDIEVEDNHNYLTTSFLVHNSAAGSAVAYCIGITNIDPVKYDLLFERFLNPDRKSMPDIDTDFDDEGRQRVIDYVVEKYGKNQVAQIITYGSMAAKMSIKDVARVLDLPLSEANALAKLVPEKPGISLNRVMNAPIDGEKSLTEKEGLDAEAIDGCKKLREIYSNKESEQAKVLASALKLEGSVRNTGIHAAGIIIAPQDLTDLIPVSTAKDADLLVTQFEGKVIEDAGVIKMDFLGLKNLTILRDALAMIKQNHGVEIDIDSVPLDDKKTFELYQKAKTNGTFQFESSGMQKYLKELKPDKFEDLIAMNALYRPGPLAYIPNYINRKHGREPIIYDLPEMEEFLHDTYGICVTGDTLIHNAMTGEQVKIEDLSDSVGEFLVQGVDDDFNTQIAPISYWVCNGRKPVYQVKLANGTSVKMTDNHKVLTERGWVELKELNVGDFIATPRKLNVASPQTYDRDKLRVLAYLLADGSLTSATSADFISKDEVLIQAYTRSLQSFERVEAKTLMQVREVTRVMTVGTEKTHYHETNSLVKWLRSLGLKSQKGGCNSQTKFIPDFIFQLSEQDIAFFLAAYWDCDGYVGKKHAFIKTISPEITTGIQTLLLRLGIASVVYESQYDSQRRADETIAYQITVYNLLAFEELIAPHLQLKKMPENTNLSGNEDKDNVSRNLFLEEFNAAWTGSQRAFMQLYNFDRQHLLPAGKKRERISTYTLKPLIGKIELPQTQKNLKLRWVAIESISPVGEELVYDITVNRIHNFVGNNVLLHNCVYQEQVMLLSQKLASFTKGEADILRKAMGKKDKATLDKMKAKFMEGCGAKKLDLKTCDKVWTDWEAFASYAFNKSHSTCYAFVAFQTAYLKAHYTAEYMAAVLTHNANDIKKITFFIDECKSLGVEVLPCDINESEVLFSVNKKGQIRFGVGALKGVGSDIMHKILEERKENGTFKSLFDMLKRLPARTLNKRILESLIHAGALDCFGIERYRYFLPVSLKDETNLLEKALAWGTKMQQDKNSSQGSLFGGGGEEEAVEMEPTIPPANPEKAWSRLDELNYEKLVTGFYLTGHPLDKFKWQIEAFPNQLFPLDVFEDKEDSSEDETGLANKTRHVKPIGREIRLTGIVTEVNERLTRNNRKFVVFNVEDFYGSMEFALFKEEMINKFKPFLVKDTMVMITGTYQARYNDPNSFEFVIKEMQLLSEELFEGMIKNLSIYLENSELNEQMIQELNQLLMQKKGKCPIRFMIRDAEVSPEKPIIFESQFMTHPNEKMIKGLKNMGLAYALA